MQLDQNLSMDDHPGCNHPYIDLTEDREQVEQLQVDHNVCPFNETQETSSRKILDSDHDTQSQYAGTAVSLCESPCVVSGKLQNEDTGFKALNHNDAFPKK